MPPIRKTDQRRVIRQVFELSERPLSIQEVFDLGRKSVPALGIATVYRNVKEFSKKGWIKVIDLPGEPSRYEIGGRDHHHHFHCTSCNRIFDIPHCSSAFESSPEGFDVLRHDVFFYGRCPGCSGFAVGN